MVYIWAVVFRTVSHFCVCGLRTCALEMIPIIVIIMNVDLCMKLAPK